jgi:lipid-A-disaccharide synthase
MVVVYRVSRGSYWLGRLLVRLPHIALVNLVLGKRAVPELIQNDATAQGISRQAVAILTDQDRIRSIREDLGGLRERLGESGASRRAAEAVLRQLGWDER